MCSGNPILVILWEMVYWTLKSVTYSFWKMVFCGNRVNFILFEHTIWKIAFWAFRNHLDHWALVMTMQSKDYNMIHKWVEGHKWLIQPTYPLCRQGYQSFDLLLLWVAAVLRTVPLWEWWSTSRPHNEPAPRRTRGLRAHGTMGYCNPHPHISHI